jgi:tyrosyl-tRNA synthetase
MEEIRSVERLEGNALNSAKTILAFEATALAHGRDQALAALQAAQGLFGGRQVPESILPTSEIPRGAAETGPAAVPTSSMPFSRLQSGIAAFKLFHEVGLAASGAASRRLIDQGGAYLNGERIDDDERLVTDRDILADGAMVLRAGKKRFHRVCVEK